MENASKALIMAGGLLVGLIIFAIFIYEITIFSSTSHEISEIQKQEEIKSFNAKFTRFANKDEPYAQENEDGTTTTIYTGYLGRKNAISVQDFATLYNMAMEWNKNNPSEKIKITLIRTSYWLTFIR